MNKSVYKKIEITGTSEKSLENAINNAILKASETVRDMRWFEMTEVRGRIDGAKTIQWQVTVKIGFALED
ncbi:MAG: dodecin domain-containing protein [Anaerolineales bacterium]|jgi:hypothetical protein|nr:dodecin domain-containing protein [Anaerolineales bacterium]MBS3752308.1 dodecin domain-containing protein [Anaerolineales bacterium]